MERQSPTKVQKTQDRVSQLHAQSVRSPSGAHPFLELQRSIGNQAVQRLINSPYIQTKLQVSTPGDPYEQEADRVADTVMRMTVPQTQKEATTPIEPIPLSSQIRRLVQRDPEQPGEEENEETIAPKHIDHRVPLAVRDDDEEEKVATKLETGLLPEEDKKTVATKLAKDAPLQRQTREDDEREEETLQTSPIQRQTEEEEEEKVQTKSLSGELLLSPGIHSVHRSASAVIQRLCTECEEEKQQDQGQSGGMVHRKSAPEQPPDDDDVEEQQVQPRGAQTAAPRVTSSVAANIHSMNGGGSPLSDTTRAFFEPRFGADFSQVRIHTDARAAGTAKAVNAKAFTVGGSIAFGAGQFVPGSHEGQRLLAHELTHVVQQAGERLQRPRTQAKQGLPMGAQKAPVHFLPTTVQRQDAPPDHLTTLREMLDKTDVPEEDVLALLPQLSAAEKATVTTDAYYKNGMASAFNTGEMIQAVRILGLSLEKQLEWIEAATSPSNINYSEIQALITAPPQEDRDKLKTNRWRDFFVGVCDNSTIITAVTDLKFDLETQLQWIHEEASPSNLNYSEIQPLITPAPQADKDKLKTTSWRDFFVGVCTNKTIISAVTDLKFDLVTQLEWIKEEASPSNLDYSEIQPLITPAPQADKDKLKTTSWRDFFVGVCTNKTIITAVTDLKFDLVTQLEWIEEEASPSNLDYSEIQPLITPAPQTDKDKLKTNRWRDFFVGVCNNATIMNALDDLKFDLLTTIQWLLEEASVSNVDFTWLCNRWKSINVFSGR